MRHLGQVARDGGSVALVVGSLGHRRGAVVQPLGSAVKAVDLVLQRSRGKIAVHVAFPLAPPSRGAAAIDDDHDEALIGEPLRRQVSCLRGDDALGMRSTVRVEQDGERGAAESVAVRREQYRSGEAAIAGR